MNQKQNTKYFIIDFDSTFVKTEGLEELAEISLTGNPNKEKLINKIKEITRLGMEGKIPFEKSLEKRIKLLNANKNHIDQTVKILKKRISLSILKNKRFFREYKNQIYIISGGFKEFINPVVEKFNIDSKHVIANTFVFDGKDKIIGFDKSNLLAKPNGKVNAVKTLDLKGEIFTVGDGYTDYQIKELGLAKKFTLFTENVTRDAVIKKADRIAPNFDEFLYENKIKASVSYPKNRIRALLLENIDNDAVKIFEKEGYEIEYYSKSLDNNMLYETIRDVHILGIRSRTHIDKHLWENAGKLLSVGAYCVGTDQIALESGSQKGIAVFNAPYSNTRSVVELVIGEIIMLSRNVFDKNSKLHKGIWDKSSKDSNEVRGKKLGIIGYGNIGSQLSVLAENLGMEVYFYDRVEKLALGNAKACKNLSELLGKSDIVTIHVDGNFANKNLISEKEFRQMRNNVIFLNLSRGFVVDIKALNKYLKNGKIKGAGIDVFNDEPKGIGEEFKTELQNLPNVILTPHIGGNTQEAQKSIAGFVSTKIIEFINTGNTYLSVNIPNIQLPQQKNAHRLLHLHKNVPGVLAQINGIIAKYNINILGQYLKTNQNIGYLITDVNKKYDEKLIREIRKSQNTVRLRVLY